MRRSLFLSGRGFIFVILLVTTLSGMAQNNAGHNWFFGNNNLGIRFNRTDNSATLVTNKTALGTGGSGTASDQITGSLLFYTDGTTIYDVTHAAMPGGAGLGGNASANQPVAITKVPGQKYQYFVFVNTANGTTGGTISYRIVDMSLFGNAVFPDPPQGEGVGGNINVPGLTGRSEAMMAVPHANGEDFWLITHANGSPDYTVTSITAAGPGVASNITYSGVGLIEVASNFAYHAGSNRIAVSPQEATRDIEIINFNNATGVISFAQRILNTAVVTAAAGQAIYDTEFSASGQYLYISRHGEAGVTADLLQADLLAPTTTIASVLPQPINRSYGLQMGPDSVIYHLYQSTAGGDFRVASLTGYDTIASAVNYTPRAFSGNLNFNAMQFAAVPPPDTVMLTVNFTSQGTCANTPTSFFPTVSPAADSLVWRFGDGGAATAWSPVYTYTAAGAYNVRLTAFLNGDSAFVQRPLNITQFDLQLNLVQDTTACLCEYKPPVGSSCNGGPFQVTVQAQGGSPTYQWFGPSGALTGQTTATLTPDSAGYYYVVATLAGCAAYTGVNIKTYDSLDQRANIWYFGQNAGIDFNGLPDNPPVAISGPLNTPEGTSVISDRNGQVIFSTDGMRIYDKNDVEITPAPAPPGLGGDPDATQSALIIPVPGDETLFYIFTTQPVHGTGSYELRYSLFDLKLNNGQGGLAEYNQLLFSKSTERITSNGNWLIAHEFGNNSFRAYQITQQGIGNPVISAIGSDHLFSEEVHGRGYMEIGAQNRLAVALSTPGVSNVVEVFDFVDSTGVVTNFRTANLNSASGQVYGLEISPGGNKLFATLSDATSQIVEFAFDSLGNPYFKNRVTQPARLGAMQMGPDGQIYVAIDGSSNLGTFTANEDTTQVTALPTPLQAFALAGGTQSRLGLPNFVQTIANQAQTPGFTFAGACVGDSTTFSASGKDPVIDKFDWFFGDGQALTDGGPEVSHLYAAAGSYTVTVRIYNKCEQVGTFTQTVVINDLPPDPSQGVVLCTGSVTLDANPGNLPNFTYVWSTGDSTETIVVNRQGRFTVAVTNQSGCTRDGEFIAADNRPQVNFGTDQTICQNTPLAPLNAQNPGATYVWQLNDVANGNTAQTQSVDTATPGVFEYKVRVTDTGTPFLCFTEDSISYTINPSPVFAATATPPAACGGNGQINLNITAPATTLFTYFITGPSGTFSDIDRPVGAIAPVAASAGTYGVTVSDQVSGCATINTVSINDPAFTVAGVQNGTCDPITLQVTVSTTAGPFVTPFSYRIINNATASEVENIPSQSANPFTTVNPLASNNQQYVVEVTSGTCRASSAPITVNESANVAATLSANACVNPITVTATPTTAGAPLYAWSGPGILSPPGTNVQTISAAPPQGPQIYQVTISQPGFCDLDTAITVNVNNNVTAGFSQSDACADQVTLQATPVGTYTYRWFRGGATVLGGSQLIVGTADDNQMYRVEIVNTLSGCVFSSPQKEVYVEGDLQITLASTTPCEGREFTLTAGSNLTPVTFAWSLDGTVITGQTNATLTDTRAGLYEVSVTRGVCAERLPFNIVLGPVTAGLLTDTGIICPDPANPDPTTREVVLDPGPDFISYNWFREGVATGITTQTFTATEVGVYSVEMVNAFGCSSTDQTELFEECDPRIVGPNAFRPGSNVNEGGDYTNREFRLFTFFVDDRDFQIFIFNRWGEMVFESTARDFRWNGGYNNNPGQPLPPGTYSYIVKYRSSYRPDEGVREKRGGVVLLR